MDSLVPTTSKSSQNLAIEWSSEGQMCFVFSSPGFANRGLRSSCSEPAGESSASVTDGWKVWAEYSEQNHIRAATPNKAAVVHTSANGRPL